MTATLTAKTTQANASDASEQGESLEGGLPERHSGRTLHVKDFRNIKSLSNIPNDELISLRLGPEQKISGYGTQVLARVSNFKGKIPGSDTLLPPIHFLAREEFQLLAARCGDFDDHSDTVLGAPRQTGRTLAWFDKGIGERGGIEIPLYNTEGRHAPQDVFLTARQAKKIFSSIHHELQHAAGKGEFFAFRRQHDIEVLLGLREERVSNLEIMQHISEYYSTSDIVQAENELREYCIAHDCREDEDNYWVWAESRMPSDLQAELEALDLVGDEWD